MKKNIVLSQLLFFLFVLSVTSSAQGDQSPIRALLITGGGWHDYQTQEKLLTEGINDRLKDKIEWTIVHEGDEKPDHQVSVLKKNHGVDDYDVVVHNTGFGRVEDADFVEHLVNQHEGTPAVLIHATIHSYRFAEPADPWFEFMGLQSMEHESQREFEVVNEVPEHPIMEDFPEVWNSPKDEVYIIKKIWGDITPLARAYGKETEKYHTVVWTHEINDIRVFGTTLGHNNETFEKEEYLDMVAKGILWAADRL